MLLDLTAYSKCGAEIYVQYMMCRLLVIRTCGGCIQAFSMKEEGDRARARRGGGDNKLQSEHEDVWADSRRMRHMGVRGSCESETGCWSCQWGSAFLVRNQLQVISYIGGTLSGWSSESFLPLRIPCDDRWSISFLSRALSTVSLLSRSDGED